MQSFAPKGPFTHMFGAIKTYLNTVVKPVVEALVTPMLRSNATANYALVAADIGGTVQMTSGSANTVTIPVDLMSPGQHVTVIQAGAGATGVHRAGAPITLNGAAGDVAVGGQWAQKKITCVAANEYVVA